MAQQLGSAYIEVTADMSQLSQQLNQATQQVTLGTAQMSNSFQSAEATSKKLFTMVKYGALAVGAAMIMASKQGQHLGDALGQLSQATIDHTIGPTIDYIARAVEKLATNVAKFGFLEGFDKSFDEDTKIMILAIAGGIMGALVPAIMALNISFSALATAVWAAISPLLPFIAAGAAVAVLAFYIWKYWDQIVAWLSDAWNWLLDVGTQVWNSLVTTITDLWDGITAFFSKWGSIFLQILMAPILAVWNFLVSTWNAIVSITTTVWNGIVAFFQEWGTTILTILFLPFVLLVAFLQWVWEKIGADVMNVWNGIVSFFTMIWNAIVLVFQTYLNFVISFYTAIWNAIVSVTTSVWNTIKSFLSGIWNAILGFATPIWNRIVAFLINAWNRFKTANIVLWNAIKTWLLGVWNSISSSAGSIWNSVTSAISNAWNSLKSKASSIWQGIYSGIATWINKALNLMRPFLNGFNAVVRRVNNLTGSKIPTISMPALAKGGIVTGPTMALVGEGRHSEAVLPLSDKTFGALAEGISARMGGGGGATVQVAQLVVREEADIQRIAERLYKLQTSKSRAGGVAFGY